MGDSKINRRLTNVYYNPRVSGSYGGARGLKQRVKGTISGDDVTEWLGGQETYTLHKTPRRRFQRRKTIVAGMHEQWQCDLIDLTRLKKHNRGKTFVLTAIDVFSKVADAVPLANKTSSEMIRGLKILFKRAKKIPRTLQTDKGKEFLNGPVQAFLKKMGVHHFVTENDDIKAAVIERYNRTLKERLWRYFTRHKTLHYLKVLPMLVSSYNRSFHRTIGMAPTDVSRANQEKVWHRLYQPDKPAKKSKPKLKVGDRVRLSHTRRPFKKGYLPAWTKELFVVTSVLNTRPVTYTLEDLSGEALLGTFYAQELQRVSEPLRWIKT